MSSAQPADRAEKAARVAELEAILRADKDANRPTALEVIREYEGLRFVLASPASRKAPPGPSRAERFHSKLAQLVDLLLPADAPLATRDCAFQLAHELVDDLLPAPPSATPKRAEVRP